MKLTMLGTGNAQGIPVYGCHCPICERARICTEYRRRTHSAFLEAAGLRILIDAGPADLHTRFPPEKVDGIFITHFHIDHFEGLFQLRWGDGAPIPVYAPKPKKSLGAKPLKSSEQLDFQKPVSAFDIIDLGALRVTALPLNHGPKTFGYLFESDGKSIAYLTDTCGLPPTTEAYLKQSPPDLMVIDTCHPPSPKKHNGHNDLSLSLDIHRRLGVPQTLLTHISHELDNWFLENGVDLPKGVVIAVDGMEVTP